MSASAFGAFSGRDLSHDDDTTALHSTIYETFLRSPTQNEAYDIIVSELLQGEFRWTAVSKTGEVKEEVLDTTTKEHRIWSNFVRQMVLQIMVFGFAVYRLAKTGSPADLEFKDETTSRYQKESVRIEVANSQNLVLTFNRKKLRWEVYESGSSTSVLDNHGGWHLLVFSEPRLVGSDDTPLIASPAAKSYFPSIYLERLHFNVQRRDAINTDPVVYTTTSKAIMGGSARPLMDGPRDTHTIIGETREDFSTWLAKRLDTFRQLDRISSDYRKTAQQSFAREVAGTGGAEAGISDLGGALKPTEVPRELIVGEGRDAAEMGERKGPQNFEMIEKSLRQSIMKAWQIPLQVTGENINSERLASSDRLSQMAISRYDAYIKRVRSALQGAIDILSGILTGGSTVRLKLWPCVSAYNLSQMEPILTAEAAHKLNACVYDVPEYYIDRAKVKERQKIMIEGTQPDGSVAPNAGSKGHSDNKRDAGGSGKGVRNKPKMATKAKETRKAKKAAS